jgi:hypothetical protein
MPRSPSIVPDTTDRDIYFVLEVLGRAWRETDDTQAGRATLIRDMLDGQYEDPVRILSFNTAQGWSRDVAGARFCPTKKAPDFAGALFRRRRKRSVAGSTVAIAAEAIVDPHGDQIHVLVDPTDASYEGSHHQQ